MLAHFSKATPLPPLVGLMHHTEPHCITRPVAWLTWHHRYKFCVAMENSIEPDYISEKIWDALAAGCIPIYLGARSARNIVPDATGVIWYDPSGGGDAATPEALAALLAKIGSDQQRYEAMMAWHGRAVRDALAYMLM
jgi:Glycosyltransferase family 10 (fucosyltransferase) C-term